MSGDNALKSNVPPKVIDKKDSTPFEIDHTGFVSKSTASMFLSPDLSDVTFVVEEKEFPAHKFLLVAQSKYFRAMFLGGLKESNEDKVVLKETNSSAFHALLKYIYTGKLSMDGCERGHIMEILKIAHKYGFDELVKAVADYLKTILDSNNVCEILNFSRLYPLPGLTMACIAFAERNTQQVLTSQGFLQLPVSGVTSLLSPYRFHLCAITVFRAVRRWIMAHKDLEGKY
uniref:BTB domain-containing protein n=1 Tax=Haemonchus contortus TaxID=6289 RepID=A0A7I4YR17_HAECO